MTNHGGNSGIKENSAMPIWATLEESTLQEYLQQTGVFVGFSIDLPYS
ncbi:MAG: hypothetical protein RH949_20680 [Coleofasciculus sp. A1-SPW-01]|nr:hypothetical protein [Coleofasciculus chthonoplastes]